MKFGYARVSTKSQSVDAQLAALLVAGVAPQWVFTDIGVSGRRAARPGLDALLAAVSPGDEVVITKLDRLGRSMLHTAQLANDFRDRGIGLRSLTEGVDTDTVQGRLLFNLLATFAEYERELIVERTRAGLEHSRENGRLGGRRKVMQRPLALQVKSLSDGGYTAKQIGEHLGVSTPTAYRYLQTYEEALELDQ